MEEQKTIQAREEKKEKQDKEKKEIFLSIQSDIQPLIIEANEIASQFGREIKFSHQYATENKEQSLFGESSPDTMVKNRKEKIEVRVEDFDNQRIYLWTPAKFRDRFQVMKDMIALYTEQGTLPDMSELENPFYDEPEPMLIGEGFYSLQGLANLMDNPSKINLIGSTFEVHGKLDINIVPVNSEGSEELDFIPDEPSDLIDQRIDFIVQIDRAHELPENLCRDVFAEYSFYLEPTKYRTKVVEGKNRNPEFGYNKLHTVEIVTKMLVDYLEKETLCVRLYGFGDVGPKKPKTTAKPIKKPVHPQENSSFMDASTASDSFNTRYATNISGIVVNDRSKPVASQQSLPESRKPNTDPQTA